MLNGKTEPICKNRPKTESSCRTLPIIPQFEDFLLTLREKQKLNRKICGNFYCRDYLDYV